MKKFKNLKSLKSLIIFMSIFSAIIVYGYFSTFNFHPPINHIEVYTR